MRKSTAILWIAVMGIIAAVFCILFISGSIRNDALIEDLKGKSVNQAARIMELDADNAQKDTLIGDLSAESLDRESRMEALNLEIAEKKTAMEQKESELAALKHQSASQQKQIDSQLQTINDLKEENKEKTEQIEQLQEQVNQLTAEKESLQARVGETEGKSINRHAVTNEDQVSLCQSPDTESHRIRELPLGQSVLVLREIVNGKHEKWAEAETDGETGFILMQFLDPEE